jgi:hypothetical protein
MARDEIASALVTSGLSGRGGAELGRFGRPARLGSVAEVA